MSTIFRFFVEWRYVDLRHDRDKLRLVEVGLHKLFPGQGGEFARSDEELRWFLGCELEMNGGNLGLGSNRTARR